MNITFIIKTFIVSFFIFAGVTSDKEMSLKKKNINWRLQKIGFSKADYTIIRYDLEKEEYMISFTSPVTLHGLTYPKGALFNVQQQMEPKKKVVCPSVASMKDNSVTLENGMKCWWVSFNEKKIDHCTTFAEYTIGNFKFPQNTTFYFNVLAKSKYEIKYILLETDTTIDGIFYKMGTYLSINGNELKVETGDLPLEREYSCPPYDTSK